MWDEPREEIRGIKQNGYIPEKELVHIDSRAVAMEVGNR